MKRVVKRCKHVVTSKSAVAKAFGESVPVVNAWMRDKCPGKQGHYDLLDIAQWLLAREKIKTEIEHIDQAMLTDARKRHDHYAAERQKLKHDLEKKKVVTVIEKDQELFERCSWFSTVLSEMPAVLAPVFANKSAGEIRRDFDAYVDSVRIAAFGESDD